MSRHATHAMHENSLEAHRASDFSERARAVLDVYLASFAPKTDKEVMEALGFKDANHVRPRITELCESGYLWECGKVKDAKTNRSVRCCAPTSLARPQPRQLMLDEVLG